MNANAKSDPESTVPLVKSWIELLAKGQGLVTTLTGGLGAVLPFALPVPKVLTPYMITMTVLVFPVSTLWALGVRRRGDGSPRPMWGLLWAFVALVSLLIFIWLLDIAPQWTLIHTSPRIVRAIAAVPYGIAVGMLCGAIVLLLPVLPKGQSK